MIDGTAPLDSTRSIPYHYLPQLSSLREPKDARTHTPSGNGLVFETIRLSMLRPVQQATECTYTHPPLCTHSERQYDKD